MNIKFPQPASFKKLKTLSTSTSKSFVHVLIQTFFSHCINYSIFNLLGQILKKSSKQ